MTRDRCLMLALLIIWAICEVCSKAPERLCLMSFLILCSIKLFAIRKECTELRTQDVNAFKCVDLTYSSVIGWKLEGSLDSPFLWIRIVQALFHSSGMSQAHSVTYGSQRKGQRLKHSTESWLGGHGCFQTLSRCFHFTNYLGDLLIGWLVKVKFNTRIRSFRNPTWNFKQFSGMNSSTCSSEII